MDQYDPSTFDPAAASAAADAAAGAAMGAMIVGGIIYGWLIVFMICSLMGVFIKAGKPWWAAIVPIYNIVVLLEIIGKPIWWIILFLIPFVNIIVGFIPAHSLSKSFGKDIGFTVGLILLGIVFYPILAFGDSQYQGPAG